MRVFSRVMKDVVNALPWRLAAVAALAVMGLGWMTHVDLWIVLARAGGVFALFWVLGAVGCALCVRSGVPPPAPPGTGDVPSSTGPVETPEGDRRAKP